jgi:hypothetical protein
MTYRTNEVGSVQLHGRRTHEDALTHRTKEMIFDDGTRLDVTMNCDE